MLVLVIAAGWFAAAAGAQPWSGLRAKNPPGAEVSLRLLDPHPYRQGEVIRVEMQPQEFGPTRNSAEQWQLAGLLLDPEVGCGSVAKPCLESGGIRNGLVVPQQFTFLNRYLPQLPPGHYRAAVLARKLVLTHRDGISSIYGYAEPPEYAVSETAAFDVVPASAQWIRRTIATSAATLRDTRPASRESYEARDLAAQQLRFLDEPGAWLASLSLLPEEAGTLLRGLDATRQPARVCELMQSRIPVPEQAVSSAYLWTLQQACARANLPPPPAPKGPERPVTARIAQAPPPAAPAPKIDPVMQGYLQKLRAYQTELWGKATGRLAASLPQKQPGPKAAAFATLLEYVQQHRSPAPPWIPALTREFVAWFPSADLQSRHHLLDFFASAIRSPEAVPLIESVLDRWKPGDYYEAVHSALRDLYEIDRRRAQARILAELPKPETWLDVPQLDMLPANAVPPMDDALIAALAAAQRPPGWNPRLRMAAIAKYATARAEPRIRAIYESQQDPCQPELIAYFVRVDPAYADRVFHRQAWDMHAPPSRCTVQYFERTPPLAMAAPIERFMEAYLMHSDVFVKTAAAHQLGIYGSPAAVSSLWDAFRYFHDYWKGKEPELEQNGEGAHLEVELRNAIARGRHWLATETDLRTIESLCISRQCRGETLQDLSAWQRPLRIELAGSGDGWRAAVAQYWLTSLAELEGKLAQFPRGTQFALPANQADGDTVAELRRFAAGRGLVLEDAR